MSPLLSMRAPISVNVRLLGACGVMAVSALVVALGAGTDRPTAAVPACLAVGAVCAALVAHLLFASARTVADPRLLWMSAGVTVAFAGLVATLLGQSTISPNGGPISQAEDSLAARYVIWHVALLVAGAVAVTAVHARPRELIACGCRIPGASHYPRTRTRLSPSSRLPTTIARPPPRRPAKRLCRAARPSRNRL